MPVHSRGDKKETNHHDEMEVDYAENEGSSSEDEDTESSSVSEDGDSSEMDDEDCERRRMECLDEMSNLEKQFTDLKDQLYKERLSQVDAKLQEVIAGKAPEYLEPLATLQENMQIRTKVAGIYRELCLESVKNKYECEIQASRQHCEVYFLLLEEHPRHSFTESLLVSEKLLLYDTVQSELEEKIRRLEEDRHSIDITSELWNDELQSRKKRKDPFSPDKKKPVVVSGPYIVYMLQDLDILEDWTTIRKAMATLGPHRVKTELFELIPLAPVKLEKHLHSARSEEGRLYYDGEWYIRGQTICIDKKDECPTSAVITTINHDEVWFKRPDGSKSKLYISQLQKGKYSIKHS
ncbi:breast cancer metastasis-suppressor 1-like protein isoform X1 [Neophocaena asiaeorientalis asiaeorientalis]|uniref:Breast cancer metastasis-suppressor 1-like protein isoform X1 n=1 Tax=Neophocaena asiaeorientalis asiaeorientalis TaxID=1706337 RepID=A0A341CSP5_NEOAA|nr:breast cancer metastasis-suppressor 1-like protein isoform X1 [Neophocaena asiaeorientalis asiaeorientalis]XP_024617866.1 breast cancer metastasis-suppressor 1-like protein isoform X1 [Neophocaena asiaeorientalis asiaeorientalis]XP_026966884.1 breast cancer metastasis-suppressor 1-like protein isoform X1 [Lagenorhynchus obliquidens]XP_032480352.1 breast cancer metastasis-suppressor 1-like protein isoform X2 [Phocoena sinus]XP_033284281.1 breast cancer metastasis-suppressor 1-like protein iso